MKLKSTAAFAAALVLAACAGEAPSGPTGLSLMAPRNANVNIGDASTLANLLVTPALWDETVWVCKVGPTASFNTTVDGINPATWTISDGNCRAVHVNTGNVGYPVDSVHVIEVESADFSLDSLNVKLTRFGNITSNITYTGVNSAFVITTLPPRPETGKGGIITFYNSPEEPPPPPPPAGGQGCTPGYWKQKQHFDSWNGYSPNQQFSSVFENAFPGKTLLQVLSQGGGGLNALGRHTVAALLNGANPNVSANATSANVIAAFNAAYPGTNYEPLKDIFAGWNEQGCPLN